eukprot:scaffold1452_cov64-Phaeocystis_antarctica.AAC.5
MVEPYPLPLPLAMAVAACPARAVVSRAMQPAQLERERLSCVPPGGGGGGGGGGQRGGAWVGVGVELGLGSGSGSGLGYRVRRAEGSGFGERGSAVVARCVGRRARTQQRARHARVTPLAAHLGGLTRVEGACVRAVRVLCVCAVCACRARAMRVRCACGDVPAAAWPRPPGGAT